LTVGNQVISNLSICQRNERQGKTNAIRDLLLHNVAKINK